jgi:hypothetical protein
VESISGDLKPLLEKLPEFKVQSWSAFADRAQFSTPLAKQDSTPRILANYRFWFANYTFVWGAVFALGW